MLMNAWRKRGTFKDIWRRNPLQQQNIRPNAKKSKEIANPLSKPIYSASEVAVVEVEVAEALVSKAVVVVAAALLVLLASNSKDLEEDSANKAEIKEAAAAIEVAEVAEAAAEAEEEEAAEATTECRCKTADGLITIIY